MVNIDTKQLARFERLSHCITGDRCLACSLGASHGKGQIAFDHATRLAYVEVLTDEQQATTVGFLVRTLSWFKTLGISCRKVSSNKRRDYRSKQRRKASSTLDLKAKRTKA